MMDPQEILDEEYEQVLERVAAVDVAKAPGMVCTRVPHPDRPGRRRTLVWEVPATTNAVLVCVPRIPSTALTSRVVLPAAPPR